MSTVMKRNNVLVVDEAGSAAPTLVFAHGFGCDQRMWRFVAPHFHAHYRCVLFDHIGSGHSDVRAYHRRRHASLDGFAEDLLAVLDATSTKRAILVGHSAGASIGILASLLSPERFDRLLLVTPTPRFIDDPPYRGGFSEAEIYGVLQLMETNLLNWAQAFAPLALNDPSQDDLHDELVRSFCSSDPSILRRFAKTVLLSDLRAVLPRVSVPSLILQSRYDSLTPVETSEAMQRMTPHSTLKVIEARGHLPHMSDPELTVAAMQEYLAAA